MKKITVGKISQMAAGVTLPQLFQGVNIDISIESALRLLGGSIVHEKESVGSLKMNYHVKREKDRVKVFVKLKAD